MASPRIIVVAVDDSDTTDRVVDWVAENLVKPGDEVHVVHIIPTPQPEVIGGFGAMDTIVTLEPDMEKDAANIAHAKDFMRRRAATKLATRGIPYKVEILHYLSDADSVGDAVCKRAAALEAAIVVLAKHQRGKLSEFFLGSTTKYCVTHCTRPLVVLH